MLSFHLLLQIYSRNNIDGNHPRYFSRITDTRVKKYSYLLAACNIYFYESRDSSPAPQADYSKNRKGRFILHSPFSLFVSEYSFIIPETTVGSLRIGIEGKNNDVDTHNTPWGTLDAAGVRRFASWEKGARGWDNWDLR